MARLALHPQLSGVVDVDAEYRIEEIVVGEGCEGAHQTIGDIRGGAMIVGLRHWLRVPGSAAGRRRAPPW